MWLEADMEAALDWEDGQAQKCPGCGEFRDECMHPDNEGAYLSEAVRCFACQAREGEASAMAEQGGKGGPAGMYYTLQRLR